MGVVNYYNKMLTIAVSHLCDRSDEILFARAAGVTEYSDAVMGVKGLVFSTICGSDFRYINGYYYLFTGEIYEQVNSDLIGKAVEDWLVKMGIKGKAYHYGLRLFQKEAMLSMRMNNPFTPSYHVKAFTNGVVDFTDGKLRPFSSEFHVCYKNPYKYDPSARCPMWQRFLRSVLPEKESRLILQMYLGLCTFDRGTMPEKDEHCLMLYGSGANGKSVIYETITGIFGRENVSSMGLMSLIKGGDERLRNLAKIDGKVINMCPEIQAKDLTGYEDAFKTLCSGEMVYGRTLGHDVYEVKNVPRLIFNMNHIPTASDSSIGFFRRFLYVIFEKCIPEDMQNKHLADDLKVEYPGILNWVVRGAYYLKKRSFLFPKSNNSEKQMLISMAETNIARSWSIARGVRYYPNTTTEIGVWIRSSVLYHDCVEYALMNGFNAQAAISPIAFGHLMKRAGFGEGSRKRGAEGMLYKVYGITEVGLKTPPPIVNDMEMNFDEYNKVEMDKEDM